MQRKIVQRFSNMALVFVAASICFACAQKSYIAVDYRLPAEPITLAGRTVFVETIDLRSDAEIFNKRAKDKFKHFTGLFALALDAPDSQQKVIGAYALPLLFETALKHRLQQLGVGLAGEPSPTVPTFRIKINCFDINLVGQKWLAEISYEASLTQDMQLTALEVVSGSAERMKLMGTGDAEKVISEIFTDMINRLNIERLFQQAKL
ncbi:hypothetical protein [Desulfosarcina sp.]|uniref:hypothetical protein n=1 Tax=Desulfosarcina sp. TaxID=2027861 RepID=UPI0039710A3B